MRKTNYYLEIERRVEKGNRYLKLGEKLKAIVDNKFLEAIDANLGEISLDEETIRKIEEDPINFFYNNLDLLKQEYAPWL